NQPGRFWTRAGNIARYLFLVAFVATCLSIPIIVYSNDATNQLDAKFKSLPLSNITMDNIEMWNITEAEFEMIKEKARVDTIYYIFCWLLTAWMTACAGHLLATLLPYIFWFCASFVNPAHQK